MNGSNKFHTIYYAAQTSTLAHRVIYGNDVIRNWMSLT